MNSRLFGCGKFRWLAIERFDRGLSPKEEVFYRKHREVCFTCLRYEQQGINAMNLLPSAALEPEISVDFDQRVLRNLYPQRSPRRALVAAWSPAFAGAALACLAILAALQLFGKMPSPTLMPIHDEGAYNRFQNTSDPATTPNLVLPALDR